MKFLRTFILRKKWGHSIYDLDNLSSYEEETLKDKNIPLMNEEENKEYNFFKIKREEEKNYYSKNILIEHSICDNLYILYEEEWKSVLGHSIYDYEKELDHGNERTYHDSPLIPIIYVNMRNGMVFIESEDGTLYCSMDYLNWHRYMVKPQKRPYFKKIKYLKRFEIKSE